MSVAVLSTAASGMLVPSGPAELFLCVVLAGLLETDRRRGSIPSRFTAVGDTLAPRGRVVATRSDDIQALREALRAAMAARTEAENAVRESRSLVDALISVAPEGVYGLDLKGRCTFCNPAAMRILGFVDASEVVGAVMHDLTHQCSEGPPGATACSICLAIAGGTDAHIKSTHLRRADGTFVAVECWRRSTQVGGEIVGAVVWFREISARTCTEEALRAWGQAVEQTGDSVIIADGSGKITYVNPAFEQLTGYGAAEPDAHVSLQLLGEGEAQQSLSLMLQQAAAAPEPLRLVYRGVAKDGRAYQEERKITAVRTPDGEITYFVCTGRDISHRRRSEEALLRLHAQLQREASRIAGVLHDEAGQFLTLAHITLADLARDVPDARAHVFEARHQLQLVEQQLRTISHELHPRMVQERGLVGALELLASGAARRYGIALSVDAALAERCSPLTENTLYRFVQEALTNMGRHSGATAGSVLLRRHGHAVVCAVRDNGAGYDVRVGNGSPRAGLGLADARDRIEAVGGLFEIASGAGLGTELRVTVPLGSRRRTDANPDRG